MKFFSSLLSIGFNVGVRNWNLWTCENLDPRSGRDKDIRKGYLFITIFK